MPTISGLLKSTWSEAGNCELRGSNGKKVITLMFSEQSDAIRAIMVDKSFSLSNEIGKIRQDPPWTLLLPTTL